MNTSHDPDTNAGSPSAVAWRRAFAYLATLAVTGGAIFCVLHFGGPEGGTAGATLRAVPNAASGSAAGWLQVVHANLTQPLSRLLIQFLAIIASSRLLGGLFTRAGLPAVVGEMTAGILLGPSLLGLVAPPVFSFIFPADSMAALKLLSQVGISLYMFGVGMELNARHVRQHAHAAVAVSHASIVVPFLFGALFACFLFDGFAGPRATFTGFALFMGISMSITAFPVLARILQERGLSRTFLGSTAVACAAVDDITAWTLLAFVVATIGSGGFASSVLTGVLALLFVAAMVFVVRPVLPRWIGREGMARAEPSNGTLAIVVCVVFAAALSTELIGIHALFGAFLAGAVMPDAESFRQRIGARIEQFSSVLLLPLFFAYTGLRTQVGLIDDLEGVLLCLALIAVATLGKMGASAAAARLGGLGWRDALQLGALMNTRGLMELIAVNIGFDLGILSPRVFTMLVLMALATTLMTGPLLTLLQPRATRAARGVSASRA